MTQAALGQEYASILDKNVQVTPLQDFLSATRNALPSLVKWYWELLEVKVNGSSPRCPAPSQIRTPDQFLGALRLAPDHRIHYVRLATPEEVSPDSDHDQSRSGPPRSGHIETALDEKISVNQVLCTFSDEPDWRMDQDLFNRQEYGYGKCPFGAESGEGSQAPFHVAFLDENWFLSSIVPGLRRSFMAERVRVFLGLARLSFSVGMEYWGWRFTAWALHYLQDLTQPYHAKAVPAAPALRVLFRLAVAGSVRGFLERNKYLLMNRHSLFERIVHFILNDAYKRGVDHPFLPALTNSGECCNGSVLSVMTEVAKFAAGVARRIDRSVAELMKDPNIEDPDYFLLNDDSYRIDETLPEAIRKRPREYQTFVDLVGKCLAQAGRVTRYSINRVIDPGGS